MTITAVNNGTIHEKSCSSLEYIEYDNCYIMNYECDCKFKRLNELKSKAEKSINMYWMCSDTWIYIYKNKSDCYKIYWNRPMTPKASPYEEPKILGHVEGQRQFNNKNELIEFFIKVINDFNLEEHK